MKKVFMVTHCHELTNEQDVVKIIGLYETKQEAKDAVTKAKKLPGFIKYSDGFHISSNELGKDHWTEGFISWHEAIYGKPPVQHITQNQAQTQQDLIKQMQQTHNHSPKVT